jgi:hypothetical protein
VRNRLHRIATSPFVDDIRRHSHAIGLGMSIPIALVVNLAMRDLVWIAA